MHPILFRIPLPGWTLPVIGDLSRFGQNIPIYSYGVMLGLSLVVGWYLTLYLAEKDGLPKETMANCYVVTAVAAIAGSRILYVVTNIEEFQSFADIFAFRRGGLVAYGGFLGGYLGSWGYLRLKKIRLMPWADVAVPSLASGLAITRIGCYLFGCDFGKPLTASAPEWLQKVGTFPHWAEGTIDKGDGSPAWIHQINSGLIGQDATHAMPVHPTQIYESLIGIALLALLLWQRKHQRFRGQVFMLFAITYGFARFLVEIVRDDPERRLWGPELGEHVMVPGALVVFALGYTLSFARTIPNVPMRRLTQVLSFVPAIVAYLALRPPSFVSAVLVQFSTSQWIGVATAVAVFVAFAIFWKAAEAHPESAMALNLQAFYAAEAEKDEKAKEKPARGGRADNKEEEKDPEDAVDAAFDEDEEPEAKPTKKKKAKAAKGKKTKKGKAAESEGDAEAVDAKFDDDAKDETEEKDKNNAKKARDDKKEKVEDGDDKKVEDKADDKGDDKKVEDKADDKGDDKKVEDKADDKKDKADDDDESDADKH